MAKKILIEKRISVEQYNAELELALKDIKEGKTTSHQEVLKKFAKWFKRK